MESCPRLFGRCVISRCGLLNCVFWSCERSFCLASPSASAVFFFFQAEDGIRDLIVTGVQTCALPIFIPHAADRRVDVLVDGKPFTAYIYPTSTTLKKPTLYPLRTASGKLVTRGWPLDPRPGERVDHPHHIGLWFTYSDVNGLDFWNNSDAIPAARAPKMGTIVHRAVHRAAGGTGQGVLEVTADWVDHEGKALLREDTRVVFRAADGMRGVDRVTTLTALDQPMTFVDGK